MDISLRFLVGFACCCGLAVSLSIPEHGVALDANGKLMNIFNTNGDGDEDTRGDAAGAPGTASGAAVPPGSASSAVEVEIADATAPGADSSEGAPGSSSLPCKGACIGNIAGNNNGNNNIDASNNGNFNGNCNGNCMGNVIGNGNGNNNVRSNNNGNYNGNCVGNCYHNFLGNGNGNNNTDVDNNGNLNGNCRGNCFHFVSGNLNGNGNSANSQASSTPDEECVGNCFPEFPVVAAAFKEADYDFTSTSISCSAAGWTYYVAEGTQCTDITKVGHGHTINLTCGESTIFDIDVCGCNRWWYVDFRKTCRSGHGHFEQFD